ncbi:class A beta-lactamase [Puniceicoccus vermicola]|nr:class A beta-lactamase [Puniceicoccus vermicola]
MCVIFTGLSYVSAGSRFQDSLHELESVNDCRIGVAVLDAGDGRRWGYHANERFAMASTFKALLAGVVLARVDAGQEDLERIVSYDESDLLSYAPVTSQNLKDGAGGMTVSDLCQAAVVWSDNTAANLLLISIGGPEGFTESLRESGDPTTRLDRMEPDLNTNEPGDDRDTTTPVAMVDSLERFLVGAILSEDSQDLLAQWMINCETGRQKLRAGLDDSWKVGDKTGSGARGASNDVAIAWPPGRDSILIAVFLSGPGIERDEQNAIIAQVGQIITAELAE